MAAYDAVPVPVPNIEPLKKRYSDLGYSSSYMRGPRQIPRAENKSRAQKRVAAAITAMYEESKEKKVASDSIKSAMYDAFGLMDKYGASYERLSLRYTCLHCNQYHMEVMMGMENDGGHIWPIHPGHSGESCRGSGLKLGEIKISCTHCPAEFKHHFGLEMPPGSHQINAQVPDHASPLEFVCAGSNQLIHILS